MPFLLLTMPLLCLLLCLSGTSQTQAQTNTSSPFRWVRHPGNPIFPARPGTWMEDQTANPDLLLIGETYYMYFRGQRAGHDRIGVATIPRDRFDGATWTIHPEPVIDVGPPGSWDTSPPASGTARRSTRER